jgi:arabinose-5-phosphate isomerase
MGTYRRMAEAATSVAVTGDDDRQGDIAAAVQVLSIESDGLRSLTDALRGAMSAAFVSAADLVENATGRIIVTGMGKSGHVARKIAATMASVGTPAQFVHPGEASHGDLGMITPRDAVVALSNSGETTELSDIVSYCTRFEIPLIAITSKSESTLADAATVALILPATPEACPLGLAPTTSTTMMLALGDALSVALLRRKGFTSDDFQILHPGGKLARRLLRVSDIMHAGDAMPLVEPRAPMSDVLIVMTAKRHGCAGVVDGDGKLVGMITDGDLRRHMDGLIERSAEDVMTPNPRTIRPEALAAEALAFMINGRPRFNGVFAVRGGVPIGFVHLHDCLAAGVA